MGPTSMYYLQKARLNLGHVCTCKSVKPCKQLLKPRNTDCLIILCGVQLDSRARFTIFTYRNETDCLYLFYISYLASFTWHIIWTRIRKVPLQHPWATFLSYKWTIKWQSEPNEQDIQYPITYLIFMIESQSLCLYPCCQGQGSQFLHLFCNWRNFFLSGCIAINLPGSNWTPTHIWLYGCHSCTELENITWNEIIIHSLTKSQNLRTVMLMIFVQRMKMILRGQIDPTWCYEG